MEDSIIKKAREEAGISQKELAARAEKSQAQISRFEQPDFDIGKISAGDLMKISQALGIGLDELLKDSWEEKTFDIASGKQYKDYQAKLDGLIDYLETKKYDEESINDSIENFIKMVENQKKLPIGLIRGKFDSGKSYLSNKLLGNDILPDRYQPETGAINYIVHENLRPASSGDKEVLLFKKTSDNTNERFNLRNYLSNGESEGFENYKSGDLDLLNFASIKKENGNHREIEVVLIFADAPILENIILCDTPGTGGETSEGDQDQLDDLSKIFRASVDYDLLVYLSSVQGFMDDEDIEHFKQLLGQLNLYPQLNTKRSPLENVMIIMSHASQSVRENDVGDIKTHAAERIMKRIGELSEINRIEEFANTKIELQHISDRIVPFWFQIDSRKEAVENELQHLLNEKLPLAIKKSTSNSLSDYYSRTEKGVKNTIKHYESLINEKEENLRYLEELEANEPARKKEIELSRELIESKIETYQAKTEAKWEEICNEYVEEAKVESIIREKFNKKSSAKNGIAGYLHDLMQDKLKEKLKEESEKFADDVNDFIQNYENPYNYQDHEFDNVKVKIEFDPYAAFASGLAGAGTFGALSIWAASLGNLGGYILGAKAVGILSGLGLSLNAAAVSAFLAAIGGPFVIFTGLAGIVASVAWAIMGKSWQSRLSEKLVQKLENENYKEKIKKKGIQTFWGDTKTKFNQAADELEKEYQHAIQDLKEKLSNYDAERLEKALREFEDFLNFIKSAPHIERT